MFSSILVLLVVSQSLNVAAVKTTTSRVPTNREIVEVSALPSAKDFTEQETAVLAVLRSRFQKIAGREGLKAFQPAPSTGPTPVALVAAGEPVPERRDIIAVMRVVNGDATEWELVSNEVRFERVGPGCCSPCPCSNGVCAPCVACQDSPPCEGVTSGLQVTVRSVVRGQKLVKEVVLIEPVNSSLALGHAKRPTMRLRVVRSAPDQALAEFFRVRRAAFEQCARKSSKAGAVTVSFDRVAQTLEHPKAVASALEPMATECLLTVLRALKAPTGEGPATVELEFEAAPED